MKKYILLSLIFLPVVLMAQRLPVGIVSVQDSVKSIQLGVISNIATDGGKGLQLSGFSNMSATAFRGIQLSGVSNIARGLPKGIQLSGLLNVSSDYMRGLQLGSVNYVDSLNGSQIGLVNVARTHPKGWQIGLVNITNDTIAHKIGLVNINPKTAIDFMIYGGTVTTTNFGIRFRNRSTYSIVGVGTHFMGLDKKFSGAVFYRLGQYFTLTPKLSLSGDIGFYHVETFQQHSSDTPERLFSLQARVNVDYRLTNHIGAFASVGWGTTRYYKGFANYRNRPLAEIGITIRRLAIVLWRLAQRSITGGLQLRCSASMQVFIFSTVSCLTRILLRQLCILSATISKLALYGITTSLPLTCLPTPITATSILMQPVPMGYHSGSLLPSALVGH